jgi:branched-chain amino acid transport system permease protein
MEEITWVGQLLQYVITGVTVGSVYAMVAIGFNTIYNVTEVINLAQGEFVVLGGLVMAFLQVTLGIPLVAAFPATVVIVTLVGILVERLTIQPIRQPSVLFLIIATIAVIDHPEGRSHDPVGQGPL